MGVLLAGVTAAMIFGLIASTQMVNFISPTVLQVGGLEVTRTVFSGVLVWLINTASIILLGTPIVSRVLKQKPA